MIRITSTETRANGNITDYHLLDGCRAWTVTEGVYTGKRCNCPEYTDVPGVGCRHITHVNDVQREATYAAAEQSYHDAIAKHERMLAWQEAEQQEEIAAYVDAMERDMAAAVAEMQGTRRIAIELEDIVYSIGQALREAA